MKTELRRELDNRESWVPSLDKKRSQVGSEKGG